MITFFGQHGLSDYETWLAGAKATLGNSERNAEMGIVGSTIYRQVDGSGAIIAHKFKDLESAQNYEKLIHSPEAKAMIEQIGGTYPVTVWIAEEVEV